MSGARSTWLVVLGSALVAVALACGGSDLLLPRDSQPTAVALIKGNNQSAAAGGALPDSLVVRVTDAASRPNAQLRVVFTLGAGATGGSVIPDTAVTDADGKAGARWILGPTVGAQTAEAHVVGTDALRATFTATASPGAPGTLTVTTQPSSTASPGTPFARQPQVQVRDPLGNPVKQAGLAVQAALASGAGATLTGQLTASTDAAGLASFTDLALAGTAGSFTLRFSTAGLAPAVSNPIAVTGGAPSAKRSSVIAAPTSITLGSGTSTITVTAVDANGGPLPGITVVPATDGSGAFSPASGTTSAQGIATFSFSSPAAGTERISARADDVTINQTATITVTKLPTITTITSDEPDPSSVRQPYTVSFTVTAPGLTPTGDVTVRDGADSCTAPVAAGRCQLASQTSGTLTLTATYAGNAQLASGSGTAPHTVLAIPTSTSLTSEPNPSAYGQQPAPTFTAVVAGTTAAPSGTVRFVEGSAAGVSCASHDVLGTGTLSASGPATSKATYRPGTRTLPFGPHYVRACYQDADGTFAASESDVLIHRVQLTR
jgi:hypothetical protein